MRGLASAYDEWKEKQTFRGLLIDSKAGLRQFAELENPCIKWTEFVNCSF